jgi:hypothetical protein
MSTTNSLRVSHSLEHRLVAGRSLGAWPITSSCPACLWGLSITAPAQGIQAWRSADADQSLVSGRGVYERVHRAGPGEAHRNHRELSLPPSVRDGSWPRILLLSGIRSAISSLLGQPFRRTPATWSLRSPVDGRLQSDGARRDVGGGGVPTADCATHPPPRFDESGGCTVGRLKENRAGWRRVFSHGGAGWTTAHQTHDLRHEYSPASR